MNLTLCTVLASHFLLTMNIIQFAYPVHIQDSEPSVTVKWPFAEQTVVGWGGDTRNSGSTSEPHLHIHHQRQNPTATLHPILAEGLPLYFEGTDAEVIPLKGTIVTPEINTTEN